MTMTVGVTIAILAGAMNGLFPLPMKANKDWAWENNWLPFSFLSLALFPWIIAWLEIPHLVTTYANSTYLDMLMAILCGILVYTGSLLFGISITHIGVALSFALLVGTMNAVGVLVPRLLLHHSLFGSTGDLLILGGITLSVVSVVLGFLASRDKDNGEGYGALYPKNGVVGSLLAIAGGVLSGLLPVSMTMLWAHRLLYSATIYGKASPTQASNAVLALVLLGGAIPNCSYCAYLLWTNKTYKRYRHYNFFRYWLFVLAMGGLYSASIALWGVAISPPMLGALGPSVGWALFVGAIIIASTACGLMSGEWKHARMLSMVQLVTGLSALIASMILICYGNYLG